MGERFPYEAAGTCLGVLCEPGRAVAAGEIQRSAGVSGRRSRMLDEGEHISVSRTLIRVVPPRIRSLEGDGICGVPLFLYFSRMKNSKQQIPEGHTDQERDACAAIS